MLFRLMTYNILDGGQGREAAILEVVRAAAPDVLVLQEVMQPVLLERMAAALAMEYRLAAGPERGRKVALLSRLPILAAHIGRPWPMWRNWLEVAVQLPDGATLTAYGLHLVPYHAWPFELWRVWELRRLLAHLRRAAPRPKGLHLLAGDLNALAPGDPARFEAAPTWVKAQLWFQLGRTLRCALPLPLAAGYADCFRTLHPHADGFTVPAWAPAVRLDYILAASVLTPHLRACRVVGEPEAVKSASDHLPVLAEFEFG